MLQKLAQPASVDYTGASCAVGCRSSPRHCSEHTTNGSVLLAQITVYSGYPAVPPQITANGIKESYNPARPNSGGSRRDMPPRIVAALLQEVTPQEHATSQVAAKLVLEMRLSIFYEGQEASRLAFACMVLHAESSTEHTYLYSGAICTWVTGT